MKRFDDWYARLGAAVTVFGVSALSAMAEGTPATDVSTALDTVTTTVTGLQSKITTLLIAVLTIVGGYAAYNLIKGAINRAK